MLLREWIGRRVRLLIGVETRGGKVYRKGRVFRVYGHWRGRLHLETLKKNGRGNLDAIRHVALRNVELLP